MKNKLLLLAIYFMSVTAFAQGSYQYFKPAGFKIKCGCSLYVNTTFIKMAEQQGAKGILGAYVCAENKNDYNTGVIININVYDESYRFAGLDATGYAKANKLFLDSYAKDLTSSGIKYQSIIYKGVNALQYTFDQNGMPTKAIVFLKNKKSYLIQLSTRKDLIIKYNNLIQSFDFY